MLSWTAYLFLRSWTNSSFIAALAASTVSPCVYGKVVIGFTCTLWKFSASLVVSRSFYTYSIFLRIIWIFSSLSAILVSIWALTSSCISWSSYYYALIPSSLLVCLECSLSAMTRRYSCSRAYLSSGPGYFSKYIFLAGLSPFYFEMNWSKVSGGMNWFFFRFSTTMACYRSLSFSSRDWVRLYIVV